MQQSGRNKPPGEGRKVRRQPWFIMCGLLLSGLGVLGWLIFFHDGPPPEDTGLMPHWSERGGDANPLAALCRSIERSHISVRTGLSRKAVNAEPGARSELDAFLHVHANAFRAFDELASTDATSWQWPQTMTAELHPAYLSNLTAVAEAMEIQAKYLCAEGRHEEARAQCLKLARVGHGMQHAEGRLQDLWMASRIQELGEMGLEKTLVNGKDSPAQLRECLRELSALGELSRGDLQFGLQASYAWFRHQIRHADAGRLEEMLEIPAPRRQTPLQLYKPNQTLGVRVNWDRKLLQGLELGWDETRLATVELNAATVKWHTESDALEDLMDHNVAGRNVALGSLFYTTAALDDIRSGDTSHSHIRVMLALRLHELEHGSLPSTLDALVPAYLDAVPIDVYGGKSMAWNPGAQTVYSVGKNGQDDGGHYDARWDYSLDLSTRYWWREKKTP